MTNGKGMRRPFGPPLLHAPTRPVSGLVVPTGQFDPCSRHLYMSLTFSYVP